MNTKLVVAGTALYLTSNDPQPARRSRKPTR